MDNAQEEGDAIGVRWPELLVALFLMGLATLVLVDSWRVGVGWADDGPQSGYFPFYIGLALFASSGWTAFKQLRRWRVVEVFAEREQVKSVLSILLPMTVYVAGVALLGIYVASLLLIAYFMLRHRVAVEGGGHAPRLAGDVEQDGGDGPAEQRTPVDAAQHDDGRGGVHAEGQRQQDGHAVGAAQAGQHADQHTECDAHQHEADVLPGQRNAEALHQALYFVHVQARPSSASSGPLGSGTRNQRSKTA